MVGHYVISLFNHQVCVYLQKLFLLDTCHPFGEDTDNTCGLIILTAPVHLHVSATETGGDFCWLALATSTKSWKALPPVSSKKRRLV